ncbi:phage integrase [Salipiger bermudensis HTCC2601]|uniref:Phage integrase n=2 Tax=Salipiger TaxID=263377 RepID=Q0FUM5_SALBH|nr:phage integrase [Salipiger bermudensis HTCC2601]
MWRRATQTGGLFDDIGPLAHLAGDTLGMIRTGYAKWLTWLADVLPGAISELPDRRLTIVRYLEFIEANAHLSPKSQHLYASSTLRVLAACYPTVDWGSFRKIEFHLKQEADDYVSHRKDGRILSGQFVLAKSLELEAAAETIASPLKKALQQRNGTLLAFLSLIPLRRRTLTSLQLGESILFEDGDIHIVTNPELTKTKTYWNTVVPEVLVPSLQRYVSETRPWLMARGGAEHDRLWVTKDGMPLTGTATGTLIRNLTQDLFGVVISPHLFRDIAATTLAHISPEAVGHIRPLLGHNGHLTAEKYYNHATALEVGRTHASLIDSLKKDT